MAVTRGLLRPVNGEGSMRSFIVIVTLISLIIFVYYKTKYSLDEDSNALNSNREMLLKTVKICHDELENDKLLKERSDKEKEQSLIDARLLISNLKDEIGTIKKELTEMKENFNMCLIQQAQKQTSRPIDAECEAKLAEVGKRHESIIMEFKHQINDLNQSNELNKKQDEKLSITDEKNRETEKKSSTTDVSDKKTSTTEEKLSNTEKEDSEMEKERKFKPNENNIIESHAGKIEETNKQNTIGRQVMPKVAINKRRNRKFKKHKNKMLKSKNDDSKTLLNGRGKDMGERLFENRHRNENVVSGGLNERNLTKMHLRRPDKESVTEAGGTSSMVQSIQKDLPNEEKEGNDEQENNKQHNSNQKQFNAQINNQNHNSFQELNHQQNNVKTEKNEQQRSKDQANLATDETSEQNNIIINRHHNYKEQQRMQHQNDQQKNQQQQLDQQQQIPKQPTQQQQIPKQPTQEQQIKRSFNIGDQLDKYQKQLEEGEIGIINPPHTAQVKDPEKDKDMKGERV